MYCHRRCRAEPSAESEFIVQLINLLDGIFTHFVLYYLPADRLCGLVVRVSGYRYRGPGFDPRRYQIF